MKKITLLFLALTSSLLMLAQCPPGEGGQYPSSTIAVDEGGSVTSIATCNYSSEYSAISGIVAGNEYEVAITYSGAHLYVTVENSADDSVIAYGASPFTFTAPEGVTGLHLNWSEDEECTYSESGCRVTTIQDLTAAADICMAPTAIGLLDLTSTTAEFIWEDGGLSTVDYNVEIYLEDQSAENGDTPVFADANVVDTTILVTGLEPSTAYELFINANCSIADATSELVGGTFTTLAPPPANDDFVNAIAVDCEGSYTGSTSDATLDEDDAPDGFGADNDAPNVWFSYTGSGSPEDVEVSLCDSGYDTAFLVYTGVSGNLTAVGGNDDSCGLQSQGSFPSDGTTTYYICVTGYNPTSTGTFVMNISCADATPAPANDECANAEALVIAIPTSGTTIGATQNGTEEQPTCDSFGTIADVWYTVTLTEASSDLTVATTISGSSDDANVAIYSECGGLQDNSLACADDNGGESITLEGLEAGTYYIRVWSDGAAPVVEADGRRTEGTFTILATVSTLSIGTVNDEAAFTYFPNPVKNTLTLNAQKSIEQVAMYNMLGQEVLRATPNAVNSDLDMSNLQTGTYFVKVTIENVTETIRVIKQ